MSKLFFNAACICICTFGLTQTAAAQDKIYLGDGTVLDAKVKEINQRSIVYRRWDNQDGADYVLTRREVDRIVYENGSEESFAQQRRRPGPPTPRTIRFRSEEREEREERREHIMSRAYGRNILSIAGIQMSMESVSGVGLHYERILDKGGIVSLYLPAAFAFYRDEATSYTSTQYPYNGTRHVANRVFTSFYPGIKFYPGGSARRVSYSVGPSFALGFGTAYKERQIYNGTYYSQSVSEQNAFRAGFIVNNGINIQPTPHLYIGTEFGIGISYYDNTYDDYSVGDEPILQFNFKIGYRF